MSLEEQVHHALNGQPPEARARGHLVTKFTMNDIPEAFMLLLQQVSWTRRGVFEGPLPDLCTSSISLGRPMFIFSVFFFPHQFIIYCGSLNLVRRSGEHRKMGPNIRSLMREFDSFLFFFITPPSLI